MKIGELAHRAGVGIDTVRYYEKEGLLPRAQRLASGYRVYDPQDLRRLQFVRRAKALGFTLPEIRDLLALSAHRDDDMASMKAAATEKLADVQAKIAELTRIREGLETLVASCPGHGALGQCPILNALAEDAP
ncbi:heavy metal-responsive transcriptional regulator [Lysobacter solisilvae (ex Woo and Kim 2020)]|uniref:Heavy metal-responsive transcriptional regulator n=1 Tax=Agrilutibacter terrestris TaxID=2865112 RepID=A0A7H0G0C0_9GAMM|nr:heavy metal-responsive transcriptional regulator [Lysobacter terrestris]QNP41736.1 heavy metal-responsive transcriptional regulator [Lysobacter terrestris]